MLIYSVYLLSWARIYIQTTNTHPCSLWHFGPVEKDWMPPPKVKASNAEVTNLLDNSLNIKPVLILLTHICLYRCWIYYTYKCTYITNKLYITSFHRRGRQRGWTVSKLNPATNFLWYLLICYSVVLGLNITHSWSRTWQLFASSFQQIRLLQDVKLLTLVNNSP